MRLKSFCGKVLSVMLAAASGWASAAPGYVGLKYTYTLGNTRDSEEGLRAALGEGPVDVRIHSSTLTRSGRDRWLLHFGDADQASSGHSIDVERLVSRALGAWSSSGVPLRPILHYGEYAGDLDMGAQLTYTGGVPTGGIDVILSAHHPAGSADANSLGVTDVYTRSRPRRIVIYLDNIYRQAVTPRTFADGSTSTTHVYMQDQQILPRSVSESDYIDMAIEHTLVHELGHALGLVHPEQFDSGGFVELAPPLESSTRGMIRNENLLVVARHNPSIMVADRTMYLVQLNARRGTPVSAADVRPSGRDLRGVIGLWRMRPATPRTPHPPEPQPPRQPPPQASSNTGWLSWVGASWGNIASMKL